MSNNRPAPDDWRRQGQERFLNSVKLIKREYYPFREGWDHDHCEFCGDKFSLHTSDLKEGYSTEDGYHWICNQCFNDFKEEYNWQLADSRSSN